MIPGSLLLLGGGGERDDAAPVNLYIGCPVHFVRPAASPSPGAHVAALVTSVAVDGQTVNLAVQYDPVHDLLPPGNSSGWTLTRETTSNVPFDETGTPGTWHEVETDLHKTERVLSGSP
ncbi:MAG: hypothetical protein PHU85_00355 [Phycisphaerae bacterium]|nr:hypothetical protein [Phycisphaerae bacterium]